jgi:hypothetical protein
MRENQILKALESSNWYDLLHHKKNKVYLTERAIKALQTHYKYLMIGLQKVPDPEINEVLNEQTGKNLLEVIIDDMPRRSRLNFLGGQIKLNRELQSGIHNKIIEIAQIQEKRASLPPKEKKMLAALVKEVPKLKNKIKSLNRSYTILDKQYEALSTSEDEKRLTLAGFMAAKGIDYIKMKYADLTRDSEEARKEIELLDNALAILFNVAGKLPELRYMHEAKRKYEKEKMEKAMKKTD